MMKTNFHNFLMNKLGALTVRMCLLAVCVRLAILRSFGIKISYVSKEDNSILRIMACKMLVDQIFSMKQTSLTCNNKLKRTIMIIVAMKVTMDLIIIYLKELSENITKYFINKVGCRNRTSFR